MRPDPNPTVHAGGQSQCRCSDCLHRALIPAPLSTQASFCLRVGILKDSRAEIRSTHLTRSPNYDKIACLMSEPDLRTRIKEMLVKNLMLQTTPDQIGTIFPFLVPTDLVWIQSTHSNWW
jgi:hypothetical protein